MKKLILWLWQFPQNLIGFIIVKVMKAKKIQYYRCHLFYSGVSLGDYIIFDDRIFISHFDILHEIGHQKQSMILGPLYLIVIGLPSLIGNILRRFIKFDYYAQIWERWADKLGGVKR